VPCGFRILRRACARFARIEQRPALARQLGQVDAAGGWLMVCLYLSGLMIAGRPPGRPRKQS
jgi:hypothetical protein